MPIAGPAGATSNVATRGEIQRGTALSDDEKARIWDLHQRGFSGYQIAAIVRRHDTTVRGYLHRCCGVPKNTRSAYPKKRGRVPSPAVIRRRAARIRREWSPSEIKKRTAFKQLVPGWQPPLGIVHPFERRAG